MKKISLIILTALVSLAGSAFAQFDRLESPVYGFDLRFREGLFQIDPEFITAADAQRILDVFDDGSGQGVADRYQQLGYRLFNISGNDVHVEFLDPSDVPDGMIAGGNANRNRIKINTGWLYDDLPTGSVNSRRTTTELRQLIGHELFHGTQYAYLGSIQDERLGSHFMEGQAAVMEDKLYAGNDDWNLSKYLSRVAMYLDGVSQMHGANEQIWTHEYTAALWWGYLMEQFGVERQEPSVGHDFIRRCLRIADEQGYTSTYDVLEHALGVFDRQSTAAVDYGVGIDEVFLDFAIANANVYEKSPTEDSTFNLSAIDDADRFRHIDSRALDGELLYPEVTFEGTDSLDLGHTSTAFSDRVAEWTTHYYDIGIKNCPGDLLNFTGQFGQDGDKGAFAVMAVGVSGAMKSLHKGWCENGEPFSVSLVQGSGTSRISKLRVAVVGFDGGRSGTSGASTEVWADYGFSIGCCDPALEISLPNQVLPEYVGAPDAQERFVVRVELACSSMGDAVVQGVEAEQFDVWVDGESAEILNGVPMGDQYWLTCKAPVTTEATGFAADLVVGWNSAFDVEEEAVIYLEQKIDLIVVADRSLSMQNPTSGVSKMDAMQNAGALLIDSVDPGDRLGLVSFRTDATEDESLASVSNTVRKTAKATLHSLSPGGNTSIGDGLDKAAREFVDNGVTANEYWIILLSDGHENEPLYYADMESTLKSAGIKVMPIGLGGLADSTLLRDIAWNHGGSKYYHHVDVSALNGGSGSSARRSSRSARSGPSSSVDQQVWFDLAEAFESALDDIGDRSLGWKIEANIAASETKSYSWKVEEGAKIMNTSVVWADPTQEPTIRLFRPDGTEALDGVSGVAFRDGDTSSLDLGHTVIEVDGALDAGDWTLQVYAKDGAMELSGRSAWRAGDGPVAELWFQQVGVDPTLPNERLGLRGMPMRLIVNLTDSVGGIPGASVQAEIRNGAAPPESITLFDNGRNGDRHPGDGVYVGNSSKTSEAKNTLTAPPESTAIPNQFGAYRVKVRIDGTSNAGHDFHRQVQGSYAIEEPDEVGQTSDGDSDGMPDRYELRHPGLDAAVFDAHGDADLDGLTNVQEYLIGTNPGAMDTDGGGETDGSEWMRGRSPFLGGDDALGRPLEFQIVDTQGDSERPSYTFQPNHLTLRWSDRTGYDTIRVFRSVSGANAFSEVSGLAVEVAEGTFIDGPLPSGASFDYYIVAEAADGATTPPSRIVTGTARAEMRPPGGLLGVRGMKHGRVTSLNVPLALASSPDVVEFAVANDARTLLGGAPWRPMVDTFFWTLAPDSATDIANVYVRYRDVEGNVSGIFPIRIKVVTGGSTGGALGTLSMPWARDLSGVSVRVHEQPGFTPAETDAFGTFEFELLDPGTYDLEIIAPGYEPYIAQGVVITAGGVQSVTAPPLLPVDTDGDGFFDVFEWLAGTDANDIGSRFEAEIFPSRNIRWQGIEGVLFDVEMTTDLLEWEPVETLPGESSEMEFNIPVDAGPRAIYRITAREN